jgi:hypothetical protein
MKNIFSCSAFIFAVMLLPFRCMADTAICHVVDPAGKPVANAVVYVSSNTNLNDPESTFTTDKSGNFTVDNVAPFVYRCYMIDAPGYAPSGGTVVAGENTFQLGPPTKLTGKVIDPAGHPIVSAIVSAVYAVITDQTMSSTQPDRTSYFTINPFISRYTVKTDSTGTYTLDGLPMGSKVTVKLNDPRFVTTAVESQKGASSAPPLTAVAGTSISGKVIRQDGKPIDSNLTVTAGRLGQNILSFSKVAADGTYMLTGIAPGSYSVYIWIPNKDTTLRDWAVPVPVNVTASIDTPGAAPDLILSAGGLVTGSVLDVDTKQPLAGIDVLFKSTGAANIRRFTRAKTDKDGRFTARVWLDQIKVNPFDYAGDYISSSNTDPVTITPAGGQTVTMDPLLMKRAPVVNGTAVDDSGKPVPNLVLQTQGTQNSGPWLYIPPSTTSDTGSFSIHRLVPGEFWIDVGSDWVVVSPKLLTIPMTSPIKLVLKKVQTTAIQGAVVDTSNAPVAGVGITFDIDRDTAAGYRMNSQVDVTSGTDGSYTLPDAPVDTTMVHRSAVTKDGYIYKSGGELGSSNGAVTASPIVMAQVGAKVNGTVYNGLGKPVANAWVFCPDSGDVAAPVQTDANGHFDLSDLISGSVNVYAAKGLFFTHTVVQAGMSPAKSIVRLPAAPTAPIGPANLSRATAMMTKSINHETAVNVHDDGTWIRDEAACIIAEVSLDDAVQFILTNTSINAFDLDMLIAGKTDSDPIGLAKWALVPIKRMSGDDSKGQAAATIGLAVAPYDSVAAQPYYDIAKQYIRFDQYGEIWVGNAMRLTALAYALHRAEADDDFVKVSAQLDEVIKDSKTDPNLSGDGNWLPENLAKTLALGNVDKAITLLSAQPLDYRYSQVPETAAELVKPNPAAALAMYHWIAQQKNAQPMIDSTLCAVLPIIYKTDPKSAIAHAHSISENGIGAQALTELADLMPLAEAAPLYREAEDKAPGEYGNGYSPACVAKHAWLRDQALGAKLFKTAYIKFIASVNNTHQQPGEAPSYSDFAFYYSHIDPAFSRLLVEEQFAKDRRQTSRNYNFDNVESTVAAMCPIDIDRATEMAQTIEGDPLIGLKPAQYVLLTPQQRNEIPFSQWGSSWGWVPGSASNGL